MSRYAWMPKASAPQTGEHFIAINFEDRWGICGGKEQHATAIVHYWSNPGEEGFYPSLGPDVAFNFTHWMRIPEMYEEANDTVQTQKGKS